MLIRRFLLSSLWLIFFTGAGVHAATTVVIVSSERSGAYVEAAEALVSELERSGTSRAEMLLLTALELAAVGPLKPKLFIALGTQAAAALASADPSAPVLSTLLPRISFERILLSSGRKSSSQFSALYFDQPLSRQLELIRLALPEARRIGVLWGTESKVHAPALKAMAHASGLALVEATVGRDESLFPRLKSVLEEADVLLAIADPQVYNSSTVQNILLASFRAKVPLVAFSPAYVRAGALFSVYVTPAQLGRQAATVARELLQGRALPENPIYSQDFSVAVNDHVAHSLGLTLDADVLRNRLRSREGRP